MNSKIDLLKPVNRRDGNGDLAAPDVFAQNVWAKIQPITPKYMEKPETITTEATFKIIIRYLPGVTSAMIVRSEGKIYNLQGPPLDPDGRKVEMWLMCYMRNDGVTGVQA
jgi:SPP1 family predicted phage head-tail adaptor